MSFWGVLGLVTVIGVIAIVVGHWNPGVLFAMWFLVFLAATPLAPLAWLTAIVVVVYLIATHGQALFGKVSQLAGGKP
jgi:hypothetical protein